MFGQRADELLSDAANAGGLTEPTLGCSYANGLPHGLGVHLLNDLAPLTGGAFLCETASNIWGCRGRGDAQMPLNRLTKLAALLALGSFFSSMTESQLIAAMLTFGAILLLWVLDFGSQAGSSALSSSLEYLSVFRHYDDFPRGVIDTSNLIFYLSFIVLGVFLTVRSVDSMRWRRA